LNKACGDPQEFSIPAQSTDALKIEDEHREACKIMMIFPLKGFTPLFDQIKYLINVITPMSNVLKWKMDKPL